MNGSTGAPAPAALTAYRYTLLLLTCATALFYFQWRLGVMNPAYLAYSWIVFAAELIGFARMLLFLLSAARVPDRRVVPQAPDGLRVDVFIPTFGEPVDVVRRTALGARAIRYPHETWLLDDGARAEIAELARELGCRYVARTGHADAKAGNLNHALALGGGDFVALFDADHVAGPQFLDRTLGYFEDARTAFVQTPQEFYNVDSFDHLRPERATSNGGSFFHRVVQRSRDASNSTIFCGSSAVFRRAALDAIGGFATGTVSEDIHTSFRLHSAGWRSVFHPEILSAGMGPLDAGAYYRQRLRWTQDAVQLLLRTNLLGRCGLTPGQRLAYLIHIASNLEGWRHIFVYAMPIAILVTGIVPLQTDALAFLDHFLPYLLAATIAVGEFARGHARPDESAVYNLARAPATILGALTAGGDARFIVTPKARTAQSAVPATIFAEVLLVATLGAIAFAGAQAAAGRSALPGATLAVVLTWAAYHVVTAARLLVLARRCARERRARPRLEAGFRVQLNAREAEVAVASADGFTLGAPAAAGTHHGSIDAGGCVCAFELTLREGARGGPVRWFDPAARAAFDLLLHQRVIERFAETDRGDRGGAFRGDEVSRPRYPTPHRDRAS